MEDVTVVFPVKNEAANLRKALPLVLELGPIVVVDSASTDSTAGVVREFGAELLQFEWDGRFPKKRNWVLRNHAFRTDWVLFLDADEFADSAFVDDARAAIRSTRHVGFWLNYETYFMGKRLRHGDSMRKLAFFRVGAGEYEMIEEDRWSHLDMEVHEHPVLNGSIGEIKTPIKHSDFRGLKHYIAKHNEYSSWEASRYLRLWTSNAINRETDRKGDPASLQSVRTCRKAQHYTIKGPQSTQSGLEGQGLTNRQDKKYRNLAKWWFAPAYFIMAYVVKKGFLDGRAGYHFALMKAIYFYQIRLKILETRNSNTKPE